MEPEQSSVAPTSIVLISIFWILLGTLVLSIFSGYLSTSGYNSWLGILSFMIGIFLIMMGWGLLTCGKWAFYSSLILSLFGLLISAIPLANTVSAWFSYGDFPFDFGMYLWESLPLLIFIGFAAMVGFLFKNQHCFEKKRKSI